MKPSTSPPAFPRESDLAEPKTDFKGRSLGIYHPNSRGVGSALRLEPRINRDDADRYNCFFIEMAGQKSAAQRQEGRLTPATFDWVNKITVKLNFMDVAEMLTVLEGRAERIGGERNGLYHANGAGNTLITLVRNPEQGTYYFALSCQRGKSEAPQKIGITLSAVEATGLRSLLQIGLFFVTFPSLLRDHPAHSAAAQNRQAA